jgi:hypothetical protein
MYPTDWDFRRFSREEAFHAFRYERCRDEKWLREEHAEWMSRKLTDLYRGRTFGKATESFGEWGEKTIGELLCAKLRNSLPPHIERSLIDSIPRRIGLALGTLAFWFPDFPKPFLEIPESRRRRRLRAMRKENEVTRDKSPHSEKPVHLESPEDIAQAFARPESEIILRKAEAARGIIHVRIDLRFGLTAVFKALTTIAFRYYRGVLRRKAKTGRAAADDAPFVLLRRLSAERLDREGLSYEHARKLCDDKEAIIQADNPYCVLPRYGNEHSWRTAVAKSKAYAARLFGDLEARGRSPELEPVSEPHSFIQRFLRAANPDPEAINGK